MPVKNFCIFIEAHYKVVEPQQTNRDGGWFFCESIIFDERAKKTFAMGNQP